MGYIYQKPLSGKTVGVVFGSFAPLHQGHIDLIMKAKKENSAGCIVLVCGYDGDKGEPRLPHSKRYRYVREFFKDDDLVAVYPINDSALGIATYPNGWDAWLEEFHHIFEAAMFPDSIDASRFWYVGDKEYKEGLQERGETAYLVNRFNNPISGTKVRANPIFYWNQIAYPFRRAFSHNILITGTASEGKTTMVKDLGKYFSTAYSYEQPRDYIDERCVYDNELDDIDFIHFLTGQHELNRRMIDSPMNRGVFFADTDALVTKMYAEYYALDKTCRMTLDDYRIVSDLADSITRKCRWDKIFVLCPHGKFVDDNSRYMEHAGEKERWELFEILKRNLIAHGLWDKTTVLDGGYAKNFKAIKEYTEGIFNV